MIAVTAGLTACGSTGNPSPAAAPATSASSQTQSASGAHRGNATFGSITAENAGTWTITKRDGSTATVTITPSTTFGSKRSPATQSQFTVGDSVMIRGQVSGDTITATRISQARAHTNDATPSATSTPN